MFTVNTSPHSRNTLTCSSTQQLQPHKHHVKYWRHTWTRTHTVATGAHMQSHSPQPDQYLWSCSPVYLFPSPGKWFSLSAVTIMSHRVVIIVIADGPDNLPAVICTIEEYFHFSLFLPILSFSPLVLIAAAPISTLALFVVAVKEISPTCATFYLPAEGRRSSIIYLCLLSTSPSSLLTSLFLCLPLFFHSGLVIAPSSQSLHLNSLPYASHSLCLSLDPLSFHRKHQPSPGMIRLAISTVYRSPLIEESALPSFFSPSFPLFSTSFISAPPLLT